MKMKPTPFLTFLKPRSLMSKDLFIFGLIYVILIGVSNV